MATFKDVCNTVGEFAKDNAGKLVGVAMVGVGAAVDGIRRHKAKLGADDGTIVEEEIASLDDVGNEIPASEES